MIRGQGSFEFIVVAGIALFLVGGFIGAIYVNYNKISSDRISSATKEIALDVKEEIEIADGARDGYQRTFTLPSDAGGADYEINLTDGLVYISSLNGKHSLAFSIPNVTGNVQKGDNLIRKEDGVIYLN